MFIADYIIYCITLVILFGFVFMVDLRTLKEKFWEACLQLLIFGVPLIQQGNLFSFVF
jgi:hypothetical protein